MRKELVRNSKFLSLVLRHQPGAIGIQLDEHGWVDVDELLGKMKTKGRGISRALLEEIVETNEKKRFAFDENGTRIRANQGHSVEVDLELKAETPPEFLIHGTAERNVESILATGIHSGSRQHVHLSADEVTATKVGSRHGKPVLLRVLASEMAAAGHAFFLSKNGVWLTETVPPEFVERQN